MNKNKHIKMLMRMVVVLWINEGMFGEIEGCLMETLVVSLELVELEWLMRDLPLVEDFGVSW